MKKPTAPGATASSDATGCYFPLYALAAFSVPLSTMHSAASAAWWSALSGRLLVFLRNVGEHPVGKIVVRVRLVAHADLHTRKRIGSETRDDRLDPIVAAGRAVFAHTDAPNGQTNVVKITMIRSGGIL